jgi:hypothetical protein
MEMRRYSSEGGVKNKRGTNGRDNSLAYQKLAIFRANRRHHESEDFEYSADDEEISRSDRIE